MLFIIGFWATSRNMLTLGNIILHYFLLTQSVFDIATVNISQTVTWKPTNHTIFWKNLIRSFKWTNLFSKSLADFLLSSEEYTKLIHFWHFNDHNRE